MVEALGWIMIAIIVTVFSKQVAKILFPKDWK
jgi:hypothetical protein